MTIKQVENAVGLTKKAILLYEEKGLIRVKRRENDYRDYDDENICQLRRIKLFRSAGISLSDIKLYTEGLIDSDSLIKKRLHEAEADAERYVETIRLLNTLMSHGNPVCNEASDFELFNEDDEYNGEKALGIDIGTTTVSASVIDLDKKCAKTYTVQNDSTIKCEHSFEHIQAAEAIFEKVKHIIDSFTEVYPEIKVIGITGQMHGMVYVNSECKAVSDLITWRDKRADEPYDDNCTYCDYIQKVTGYSVPSGYAWATHFYNTVNDIVPKNAKSICTIMDYVAARLTSSEITMHISNSASLGLFDMKNNRFDAVAIQKLGMDNIEIPKVTNDNIILGQYSGIPVSCAIADNQASFLGAVKDEENGILLNYGTGSQISVLSDNYCECENAEPRPYINGKFLLCGAALCGGYSYAMLEGFFSEYMYEASGKAEKQYKTMNSIAEKHYGSESGLRVNSRFGGTRKNPSEHGSVYNISTDNFTPGALIIGFMKGMADELHDIYNDMPPKQNGIIIGSGNAVKKNSVFCKILKDTYKMPVEITEHDEEAAFGAVLYGLICLGADTASVKEFIKYKQKNI